MDRPAGPGDEAGDLREAPISRTLILIEIGFHIHKMNLIAPLSDEARARPDLPCGRDCRVRVSLEGSAEMTKAATTTCAERSKNLLLKSMSNDRDHQIFAQLRGWGRIEDLLPQIA
jgi:hypothetical protein